MTLKPFKYFRESRAIDAMTKRRGNRKAISCWSRAKPRLHYQQSVVQLLLVQLQLSSKLPPLLISVYISIQTSIHLTCCSFFFAKFAIGTFPLFIDHSLTTTVWIGQHHKLYRCVILPLVVGLRAQKSICWTAPSHLSQPRLDHILLGLKERSESR